MDGALGWAYLYGTALINVKVGVGDPVGDPVEVSLGVGVDDSDAVRLDVPDAVAVAVGELVTVRVPVDEEVGVDDGDAEGVEVEAGMFSLTNIDNIHNEKQFVFFHGPSILMKKLALEFKS